MFSLQVVREDTKCKINNWLIIDDFFHFQALSVLIYAIGLQKTLKIIARYPGIILIAIFSFWTAGPVVTLQSNCSLVFKNKTLGISTLYTWMNLIITLVFSILHYIVFVEDEFYLTLLIFLILLYSIVLIILILIMHGDYITNCCCNSCCLCFKNCHITQYTVLDTSNMENDLKIQEEINQRMDVVDLKICSKSRKNFCAIFWRSIISLPLIILLSLFYYLLFLFFLNKF